MVLACERCFLLLLLACDWAFDPHQGRSPQSREFSSQEVACRTIKLCEAGRLTLQSAKADLSPQLLSEPSEPSVPQHPLGDLLEVRPLGSPLVYVFMSIRR
jgi:hypothetical protein